MKLNKILIILLLLVAINSYGQSNFTFTPEKPQAGETITITYIPSGLITNTSEPLEVIAYRISDSNDESVDEIQMKRSGQSFSGMANTNTSSNLVFLKFSAGALIDNNNNNGYWIQLYKDGELKQGAEYSVGLFYQGWGKSAGVDPDYDKAVKYMDKENDRFPEGKKKNIVAYLRIYGRVHKDTAPVLIQKEIEAAMKTGLKDEDDYNTVQQLYALDNLTQQSGFIDQLKKEKFPKGKWTVEATIEKYYNEIDLTTKSGLLDMMISKINSDPNWEYLKSSNNLKAELASRYIYKGDWAGLDKAIKKYDMRVGELASLYNNTAWAMQGKNEDLEHAQYVSAIATNWAKKEWTNPTSEKPANLTAKEWEKSREATYAMYADTYAMVNYKKGNYKKGFPYSQEAALKIGEGQNAGDNNTYALLAAKVLSPRKYIPQLEQFVKDGKATTEIKDILKKEFLKKHDESRYGDYMATLEKSGHLKMVAELRKEMLNKKAPDFMLKDLNGNKINLADLRNKVLVVDFWATWCGPCKASFPAMQKMVAKYKDDADVKFFFVDTFEQGDQKEKNASDFITANKYDFQVLMDNENEVYKDFEVNGIPTKYVIDRNGNIQFKSVGFSGPDNKLISELTTMINMVKENK